MTVLVTGHSGFVGQHFSQRTASCALNRNGEAVDLRDRDALTEVIGEINPTQVLHLGALSYVPDSFAYPEQTFAVNFTGTLNLLTALKRNNFSGRVLYIGSGDMYGHVEADCLAVRESQPLKPRNPYAVSKVAAEALCFQWSQTESFDIVMARPFNHIGPGQGEQFAISDFARQLTQISLGRREPILTTGNINVTRDFTDVRDVVAAYQLLLERGENGQVYNVCSGVETSVRSLVEAMIRMLDIDVALQTDAQRVRPNEQQRMVGDPGKIQQGLGWTPAVTLDRSLDDILSYWKEMLA